MVNQVKILASVVFLSLFCSQSDASSLETWICLKNETGERKLILVKDVDNFDWDGLSRPDHNWNGTYVEAGQTRCERAEINSSMANFGFIIDGATKPQGVRMSYQIGSGTEDWTVLVGSDPSLTVLRGFMKSYDHKGYEIGKKCMETKNKCYAFFIKNVP